MPQSSEREVTEHLWKTCARVKQNRWKSWISLKEIRLTLSSGGTLEADEHKQRQILCKVCRQVVPALYYHTIFIVFLLQGPVQPPVICGRQREQQELQVLGFIVSQQLVCVFARESRQVQQVCPTPLLFSSSFNGLRQQSRPPGAGHVPANLCVFTVDPGRRSNLNSACLRAKRGGNACSRAARGVTCCDRYR